jgi:hypothetical protein
VARRPKRASRTPSAAEWRRADLHIHTPASNDYLEPGVTYLDILRRAEARGLEIVAFTDHNTVAGYRALREEIDDLELLERKNRLMPEEKGRLEEYRRLLGKILLLPGFEFTAAFGFHVLGLFPPDTSVRELEHLLLNLNVPPDQLDLGSSTVGATSDVLTAYRVIDQAGGLAIAAHVNSANGVAMRGFAFGGQTRIAYTQDPHLHALEVTDLEQKGRRTTAAFFNGSKPEYARRMHCIQGSDAHRLTRDPNNAKNLGVGDRPTEIQLSELTFDALKDVFLENDFAVTRPFRPSGKEAFDTIQSAREAGESIVQAFHESATQRGGRLYAVLADVCAFANTNGGTIYVGLSADPKAPPLDLHNVTELISQLKSEIDRKITPRLEVTVDAQETRGKKIVRLSVPRGPDPPYAIEDNKIYVRDETETSLAVRDEIVQLVLRGQASAPAEAAPAEAEPALPEPLPLPAVASQPESAVKPPLTGVEIVATEERDGVKYHTVRDLRNGSVVKNVTRSSARRLWHYAITEKEAQPDLNPNSIAWVGNIGLWKKQQRGGVTRYDLVQRNNGEVRVYYGVTEDGIHGEWKRVAGGEEE